VTPASYWKLGAFVVLGLALAAVAVVYFGSDLLGRSTVTYDVYFDESVDGLDVGSLVRYRGVTIGQVSGIAVAPDHRHVRVGCALAESSLRRQGLAIGRGRSTRLVEEPGLRAELALVGVTGQKIVLLDFVNQATHPVPALPFAAQGPTIPSAPSTLTTILDSVEAAAAQLPDLVAAVEQAATRGRALIDQLDESDVGAATVHALRRADALLATLDAIASRLQASGAPQDAVRALRNMDAVLVRLDRLLAGGTGTVGRQLDDTLREADEAFAAVRRLADEIEREPDVLLKGRRSGGGP
jgi:phospholipid/cholesterol/gamma-HCH transport system substrate-binding protein